MTDLGLLTGDSCSLAQSVNSKGQVVGVSSDCGPADHPFVWQNGGPMVDLNKVVLPGSNVTVKDVFFINDRGEIAGYGNLPNGDRRAVLLIPCDGNQGWHHPDRQQCDTRANSAPALIQENSSALTQPSSKEVQVRLVRATLANLRTQPGRYHGVGARPHR